MNADRDLKKHRGKGKGPRDKGVGLTTHSREKKRKKERGDEKGEKDPLRLPRGGGGGRFGVRAACARPSAGRAG